MSPLRKLRQGFSSCVPEGARDGGMEGLPRIIIRGYAGSPDSSGAIHSREGDPASLFMEAGHFLS